MIRLRTLRTLPFSFLSLSSVNNGRVAIHRSSLFGSSQIRRFGSTQIHHNGLLDARPSDNSELFNVLLTKADCRVLHGGLSEKLGLQLPSRVTKILKPMPEVNGIVFGVHHRPLFALVTTYEKLSYNLHFLFDTSSPFTYLSCDVN
jgi:hypothetical protein